MFISVNGKAKKVLEIFAGGTDGKAHNVKELFGSVDGIARLLYSSTPATTTGFDMFSWAEIKQLANEGKLLEYFNLYDKVTVKLKTPLEKTLTFSSMVSNIDGTSASITVPQKQTEMQFQIVELTATKMRLMTPRANVLGAQDFTVWYEDGAYSNPPTRWYRYANDFMNSKNSAKSYLGDIWGLCGIYNSLRLVQDSLPDDLVSVLSVCARPIISWEYNSTQTGINKVYDEDLKVRQLTTSVLNRSGRVDEEAGLIYPVITESYFPTTVSDYMYYITLPEEYDNYENRKKLVKNGVFEGCKFLDYKLYNDDLYVQSYCYAPEISCAYSKGMTNSEYSSWNSLTGTKKMASKYLEIPSGCTHMFPEIVIEADA